MSRRPKTSTHPSDNRRDVSAGDQVNRFDDIPAEFRHLLAENVRESRAAESSSSSSRRQESQRPLVAVAESSSAPKRKKPLTRRNAGPRVEEPVAAGTSKPSDPIPSRQLQKSSEEFLASLETEDLYTSNLAKPTNSSPISPQRPRQPTTTMVPQAVETDSEEEDEDDDEFGDDDAEWETVDLSNLKPKNSRNDEPLILELSSAKTQTKRKESGRTGPTPAERKIRLEVHKLHLLCLLSHTHLRSQFCNDRETQDLLLPILEKRVIAELNDNSFQQTKVFKQGLANAAAAFRRKFKITRPGARKALWGYFPPTFDSMWGDIPMEIEEFRAAAKKLSGSRDLGAQLFCALLRRAGLDARLVCSLQPFSYLFKAKYSIDDIKRKAKNLIEEDKDDYETSDEDTDGSNTFVGNVNKSFGGPGRPNWRVAPVAPLRTGAVPGPVKKKKKKASKQLRIHDPVLPVYWVEVFDVLSQLWIAVDPMEMGVVRNLGTFEPPIADWENEMAYVVSFDNNNKVRDITRKYVKGYNSYTRTLRVEATLDGAKWWKKALRLYSVPAHRAPDRDQFENGIMEDRLLREGIPKSMSAMKNHPVFAVEEQLRQNEVIHPKVECGTMVGKKKRPVPVYRRQDVKQVKTATQWYMLGREIKAGEQPLKHKKARKVRRAPRDPEDMEDLDDLADMEEQETGMYAYFQTILYQQEPCVGPIVPRNAYGNIDLYVPSMLPEGGVHIPHKLARVAANFLGIGDFVADAVTGFDFKSGGKSTPILNGIVAAEESEEALWAMIEHIEKEQAEEAAEVRRLTSLNLWRRFLVGLRIKERVDEYAEDDEELVKVAETETEELEGEDDSNKPFDATEGGGSVGDESMSVTSDPDQNLGGGFFTNDIEEFAGETMRGAGLRGRELEGRRLLEEARWKFAEAELQKVEMGDLYDPDAFEGGGGFFVEDAASPMGSVEQQTSNTGYKGKGKEQEEELGGGFMIEEENLGGGFLTAEVSNKRKRENLEEFGGGFMVDEEEDPNKNRSRTRTPESSLAPRPSSPNKLKRKSGDVSHEGGSKHKRGKSASPMLNEILKEAEEEPFEDGEGDDIQDDEFEYEDAGWTSN
ncbi:hypothetical protein ABW20_dc0106226 [Dactylellina cionopaga]|nr:hypothetical protein ABW20_dc0106226 [Dactylellina cionopaga]